MNSPSLKKPGQLNSSTIQASPTMRAQRGKLGKAFGTGKPATGKTHGHQQDVQHQEKSQYLQAWRIDAELNELIRQTRMDMQVGMQLQGSARIQHFADLAAVFEKKCQALCQNDESGRRNSHDVAMQLRELADAKQPDKKMLQVEHVIDAMKRRITLGK